MEFHQVGGHSGRGQLKKLGIETQEVSGKKPNSPVIETMEVTESLEQNRAFSVGAICKKTCSNFTTGPGSNQKHFKTHPYQFFHSDGMEVQLYFFAQLVSVLTE